MSIDSTASTSHPETDPVHVSISARSSQLIPVAMDVIHRPQPSQGTLGNRKVTALCSALIGVALAVASVAAIIFLASPIGLSVGAVLCLCSVLFFSNALVERLASLSDDTKNILEDLAGRMEQGAKSLVQVEASEKKAQIHSSVNADLLGRYSESRSVSIYQGNQLLFDSSCQGIAPPRKEIIDFCNSAEDKQDLKLRRLALHFGTQTAGNPFFSIPGKRNANPLFNAGLGLNIEMNMAESFVPGAVRNDLWKARDVQTHAKVTIVENELRIDELSFEIIIPRSTHFNNETKEMEGEGKLLVVKTVIKNVMFRIEHNDAITVYPLDNYIEEKTLEIPQNLTPNETRLIDEFRQLAKPVAIL